MLDADRTTESQYCVQEFVFHARWSLSRKETGQCRILCSVLGIKWDQVSRLLWVQDLHRDYCRPLDTWLVSLPITYCVR